MIERAGDYIDHNVAQRIWFHKKLVQDRDTPELSLYPHDLDAFFHIESVDGKYISPPKPILTWGVDFIGRYRNAADAISSPMVERKIAHTKHVMQQIYDIAVREGDTAYLRELISIGFLHDLFRFPQAVRYRTFSDGKSFDHADMAAECIARAHLPFAACGLSEIDCLNAIALHSQLQTPPDKKSQYIRNADKLIIIEEFIADNVKLLSAGIAPQNIDDAALEQLLQGQVIKHSPRSFEPVNRTLQRISWINELNFQASRDVAIERQSFERLFAQLGCLTQDPRLELVEEYIASHSLNSLNTQQIEASV